MINNVVLVGRLTKDPELKYTASGTAVSTFTLAVNRNFKNQNGQREADFLNCVIWRKSAETLVNYAKKGTLLGVTGRIQTRTYDNQEGQRVYVTEVNAENFQLLESKKDDSGQYNSRTGAEASFTDNQPQKQQDAAQDVPKGYNNTNNRSDGLPF